MALRIFIIISVALLCFAGLSECSTDYRNTNEACKLYDAYVSADSAEFVRLYEKANGDVREKFEEYIECDKELKVQQDIDSAIQKGLRQEAIDRWNNRQ